MDEYEIEEGAELLMHTYETLPKKCKKYWKKRYLLFSKFDEGVYMTSELWYSVTPEDVAALIARLVKVLVPKASHILDVCCGGGGNSIQFAKLFESVGAIDINRDNLTCTEHNASVYGVAERIWLQQGDWKELVSTLQANKVNTFWIPANVLRAREQAKRSKAFDVAFLSPPWGGPDYKAAKRFDLYAMEPFSAKNFLRELMMYSDNVILFLPKNLDLDQLRDMTLELGGPDARCRVLYVEQYGYCIALLALWGLDLTTGDIDYDEVFGDAFEEGSLTLKAP